MAVHGGDPSPYRPMPANFAGPVCAECRHSWVSGWAASKDRPHASDYYCGAVEPKVERPAERNPITGEVTAPHYRHTRCDAKNENGDCSDYEVKPAVKLRLPSPNPMRNGGNVGGGAEQTDESQPMPVVFVVAMTLLVGAILAFALL